MVVDVSWHQICVCMICCSCIGNMSLSSCRCFYVCVSWTSCGSPQCCILHDLQFVNAGRGCKWRPYGRGIFRTILLKAASHHIPTGRHRLNEEPVPPEIVGMMTSAKETSPELPRLNKDIQKCIYVWQRWRDFVKTMDKKTDLTKVWRTIKGIDGRATCKAEK